MGAIAKTEGGSEEYRFNGKSSVVPAISSLLRHRLIAQEKKIYMKADPSHTATSLARRVIGQDFPGFVDAYHLTWENVGPDSIERFRCYAEAMEIDVLFRFKAVNMSMDMISWCLVIERDGGLSSIVLLEPGEYLLDPFILYKKKNLAITDTVLSMIKEKAVRIA